MSDVTGMVAAFMAWRATQRDVQEAKKQGQEVSIETAKAKRKESFYSMLKLMADVATYELVSPRPARIDLRFP